MVMDKPPVLVDLQALLGKSGGIAPFLSPAAPLLGQLLGIHSLNRIYREVHARLADAEHDPAFFMKTLRVMRTSVEIDAECFERFPADGPLIVIANHPYGGIDGVAMGALLASARRDCKLMGNFLLSRIDGMRGSMISVDPFEREGSARSNLAGMREALQWLRGGGCLGVFPAGEVSAFNWRSLSVVDRDWSPHVVPLALRTGATVLPMYFEGRNRLFFQLAGLLHPRLRTLLLAREFCNMQDSVLRVRIGRPIPPELLKLMGDSRVTTDYLRLQAYALQQPSAEKKPVPGIKLPFRAARSSRKLQPIAPAQLKHRLRREIEGLPESDCLVDHGNFRVFCTEAARIPHCLREIGRLREETFRSVGEGTGEAADLDAFDEYYSHLFMWDAGMERVVGAYRIGLVDRIVEERGKQGLYTAKLFKFRGGFLEKLGPALELGRSFISLDYQKKHASLALLWRGIGEYVVRNPRYKTLFGPVSITNSYDNLSKDLMVHYLREHNFDEELSVLVQARKPPKAKKTMRGISLKGMGESLGSVGAVSAVVSGIEEDKKGIPVLLRHYLKLNGNLLSFNVDPAFSDVIDGLILVDLMKTDPKVLQRYMGKDGYGLFRRFHCGAGSLAAG